MKYCKKCREVSDDSAIRCPKCGSSEFGGESIWVTNFAYDDEAGSILANGKLYSVADIAEYHIVMAQRKEKGLVIFLRDGTQLILGTDPPSLLKGYGEKGKFIDMFEKKYPKLLYVANTPLRDQVRSGRLPRATIPDNIFLEPGEYIVRTDIQVKFSQERTKTSYSQMGMNVNMWEGASYVSSEMVPTTSNYLADLDKGRLIITNKKLMFVGGRNSFIISLDKILAMNRYLDGIGITTDADVKQTFFLNIDGNLYADIIQILRAGKA